GSGCSLRRLVPCSGGVDSKGWQCRRGELVITERRGADFAILEGQLGRLPRGVGGIAARSAPGEPLVVATAPRLEDGTPFPTTFYLTHPAYVAECSRLEASGIMAERTTELSADEGLAGDYAAAHRA